MNLGSDFLGQSSNGQSGTAYTFVLSDVGRVVEGNNGAAQSFTVPPVSIVAWPTGASFKVYQQGAGQITIAAGTGVILRSDGNRYKTAAQFAVIELRMRANDEWVITGDATA